MPQIGWTLSAYLVVRDWWKDDEKSQRGRPKFDPRKPLNLTQLPQSDRERPSYADVRHVAMIWFNVNRIDKEATNTLALNFVKC